MIDLVNTVIRSPIAGDGAGAQRRGRRIRHDRFRRRSRGQGICRFDRRSERSSRRAGHQPERFRKGRGEAALLDRHGCLSGSRNMAAIVDLISPEANRQKATVQVRVKVSNPDDDAQAGHERDGVVPRAAETPATPRSRKRPSDRRFACRRGRCATARYSSSRMERRSSEPSRSPKSRSAREVEVRSGLIGGEDLIVSPPESLDDGAKVKQAESKG